MSTTRVFYACKFLGFENNFSLKKVQEKSIHFVNEVNEGPSFRQLPRLLGPSHVPFANSIPMHLKHVEPKFVLIIIFLFGKTTLLDCWSNSFVETLGDVTKIFYDESI